MKVEIKKMKLSDLIPTTKNPRKISKEDLGRLQKSVKAFPKMLDIREIVIDENNRILGGHQRVKALIANGETEVNVKVVSGLTEKEKDEFMIRDNVQNGEWDEDGYKIVAEFYYYSKPEENCKVIGNIHENKELLEVEE